MMSRDLGGIQQAYIDYSDALNQQGHEVINITSTNAQINNQLEPKHTLPNLSSWCFISKLYLGILISRYKPDFIICHGNRAIIFACGAAKPSHTKIIGVSHNYSYKKLQRCDYIITLTEDLKQNLINNNVPVYKLIPLSNMIRINNAYLPKPYRKPMILGSLGRFVRKKGFLHLIQSIDLLKKDGYYIKLILGGDGEERTELEKLVSKLNLTSQVDFIGWVKDKNAFFNQIDIFCLPSISEPFGIILLEAIEKSKPIIATRSGGPQEIIRDKQDGLIADIESPEDLAAKIKIMINDKKMADKMSKSAYNRIIDNYNIKIVSQKLSETLIGINK
jgi:glycosyltransferase involved in cell wall biosynthesis